MKLLYTFLCAVGLVTLVQSATAQTSWPKALNAQGNNLKLYEWQPESFADNTLKGRAAVSVVASGKTEPVFGMAWIKATTETINNQVRVTSARISSLKLPEEISEDQLDEIKQQIEQQIPSMEISFRYDQLQQSLQLNTQQTKLSSEISNKPPKVIYANQPSVLVLIDGNPQLKKNDDWGMEAVVNTPFTIVKNRDGKFYLYGGKHWYAAPTVSGPYALTTNPGSNFRKIEQAIQEASKGNEGADDGMEKDENTIYKVIVSTEPAELIQSKGEANLASVEGTSLLYVSNSDDNIFMDIASQQYFVLISGRWYQSKTLTGTWNYVPADNLPADFAKIPEGSDKDNVLASVAGTDAAKDALREAEVPQTAKVEREKARAEIDYDGNPEFEDIDGTDLAYATNTPASVLRWRGRYYSVDNGVWFESRNSNGPWVVADERPTSVALIPPRYPVYNVKYVYIYDVTPDYVYMGYTPGYLNAYIYGPTIVYGTGWYYRPWHRTFYYPRPCTWGYGVRYNPWFGWGFGFNYNSGWFNASIGYGSYNSWNYWSGGWWGPRYYSAPYCYRPVYHGRAYGYYNNRYYDHRSNVIVRANRTVNVYNNRRDVVTRDNQRYAPTYRYNNRRDYANNPNNVSRPGRDYNRANNGNNSGREYNNRNNRTDNPRTREFNNGNNNNRPNRTYTPGNNNTPRNGGRTYERGNSNNPRPNSGSTPGSSTPGSGTRPGRTYTPGSNSGGNSGSNPGSGGGTRPGRSYTNPGNSSGTVEQPARQYNPGANREGTRREFERPSGSNANGNRETTPARTYERSGGNSGRTYERSNSGGSGRTYSPPARQSAPVERRVERRESNGGGGSRSSGGGSRPSGGGSSERQGGGGGRPSRG